MKHLNEGGYSQYGKCPKRRHDFQEHMRHRINVSLAKLGGSVGWRNKVRQPLGELHISSLRPSQQNLALFAPTVNRTVLFFELETHSEK